MEATGTQAGKEKQILAAARRIFATTGYYQARVEDIAREAGIGKGTVYEYFTSKEELYLQMLLEIADSYASGLAEVIGRPGDLREKLLGIGRHLRDFLQEHGQLARMFLQDPGPVNRKLQDHLLQIRRETVQQVEKLLAAGAAAGHMRPVDTGVAARFFLGGLAGVLLPGLIEELAPPEALAMTVDIFLQGIDSS
ncbi:MAG TPA: TetR/AcrR family transcriptional regulator [Firmicutes bacterium]|nr:TetR/AcrR family transcriptional regulator [Bacillota bacterium]